MAQKIIMAQKYVTTHDILFNPEKCKYIVFGKANDSEDHIMAIKLNILLVRSTWKMT